VSFDPQHHREYSKDGSVHVTDERVNTITHMAAAVFALFGCVLLIAKAGEAEKPWHIVAFSVYGVGLVGLFVSSALHHGIDGSERTRRALRTLDYAWIFVLIAATFTPICLVLLRGVVGWTTFGVVWGVGLLGIALKVWRPGMPKWVTNTLYLALGWLGLFVAWPLSEAVSLTGIVLLAAGGVLYTAGGAMYAMEKPNPVPGFFGFHEIWHLFVIAGAFAHFLFMYACVLPAS
jgi:hemolysin III